MGGSAMGYVFDPEPLQEIAKAELDLACPGQHLTAGQLLEGKI